MKYAVILGDGMADRPIPEFDNKTPLEKANIPTMDKLASIGETGLVQTIPEGFSPGSDVANLSVMGFHPAKYYSGRSPLEALSMGIDMAEDDIAVRCNLVTLSGNEPLTMVDYSAGEISTPEARELIKAVHSALGNDKFQFYGGVSYRHCLIIKKGKNDCKLTPPHDITGREVSPYLPYGGEGDELRELILASHAVLKNHPVNLKRVAEGKKPATHIWLWGAGKKPLLDKFVEKYGLKGSVISAVDLLKGIAVGSGMEAPEVEGATGNIDTNIEGKLTAVFEAYEKGCDYTYLHIEAPDECGHQGNAKLKVKAIEMVDYALKRVWEHLEKISPEGYVIALLPDHATPIEIKTHSTEPVPFVVYNSTKPANSGLKYNEKDAQNGTYVDEGCKIVTKMLEK